MFTVDDEARIFNGVMVLCLNQDVVHFYKQRPEFETPGILYKRLYSKFHGS